MKSNLFAKICQAHGIDTEASTLAIYPDQTLVHDATGTPVFLQLEAMSVKKIKPFTVVYVDHNTLQVGFPNPDDHRYLKSMAAKLGALFSRPGNGICHQVHLENFVKPGSILFGSDSHTPTAGGLACLGLGAGGLDVATALAGEPYYLSRPTVYGIRLSGKLNPWVSAKDIILYVLGTITVKGGVGKVLEYFGPGVANLSVYDRATICNMGAEAGATSSIFPSDQVSLDFLERFGRKKDFQVWKADKDAEYDDLLEIDLDKLEPMVALPHSPDNVKPVSEAAGVMLDQICIGSCTNSSFKDLAITARVLNGQSVYPQTELAVSPGSRRTLSAISQCGDLNTLIQAGARILECACGPCNGIGQSPASGANTLRTHNRNFKGRCGTLEASSYLCSAETAAVSALHGVITDPRTHGDMPEIEPPPQIADYPSLFLKPADDPATVDVVKGPNIKPIPLGDPPAENYSGTIALKLGDDVTTDDIIPGGAKMLSLRSNIPDSVPYIFQRVAPEFASDIDSLGPAWIVVGGENYGQGSSREHAVMVPMYAGLRLVIVKSFARIHRQNLVNFGVVPLTFVDPLSYEQIEKGDELHIADFPKQLMSDHVTVENVTKSSNFKAVTGFSERERNLVLAGGLLNQLREKFI